MRFGRQRKQGGGINTILERLRGPGHEVGTDIRTEPIANGAESAAGDTSRQLAEAVGASAGPDRPGADMAVPRTARELAELAQTLAEQAAELRRQWQELSKALSSGSDAPALPPLRPPAALSPEGGEQDEERGQDPVQLVALSMAAAHSSRREVEEYLRSRLGVEDSRELLDGIFGPVGTELPGVPRRRRGLFARTTALGDERSDELAEARDET